MDQPQVQFVKLHPDAQAPQYATPEAAGADLFVYLRGDPAKPQDIRMDIRMESLYLAPGGRALVPCGVGVALQPGWEGQIRGRSGLALRNGLSIVNGVGTIDSDYRGEICVLLINHGQVPFLVRHGDRIAQMVIAHAPQAVFVEVDKLSDTARGAGGFGSTGTSKVKQAMEEAAEKLQASLDRYDAKYPTRP